MKHAFRSLALLVLLAAARGAAAGEDRLFETVPPGDPTYALFERLEGWGLLPEGTAGKPLTRYEAAEAVLHARRAHREIVVAQLGFDLPPPDFSDGGESPQSSGAEDAAAGSDDFLPPAVGLNEAPLPGGYQPASSVGAQEPAAVPAEADGVIDTLEEAYQAELSAIRKEVENLAGRSKNVDERQFALWKSRNVRTQKAGVWLHGLGRAFTDSAQTFGSRVTFPDRDAGQFGYLDFRLFGTVTKQVRWNVEFRLDTDFVPTNSDALNLRRVTLHLEPEWLSAEIGDFDEVYTPLTLWNRNSFDFHYAPQALRRNDRYLKYESYLHREPLVPLRGIRLSEALMWPGSSVFERLSLSGFVGLAYDGFNDAAYGIGFSNWVFGGKASLAFTPGVVLETQGLLFDEPLDTDKTVVYVSTDPTTWAQRYETGGARLLADVALGGELRLGGAIEGAASSFQDDKRVSARRVEDVAFRGGPMVGYKSSTLRVVFLDTGELYFSPLAQFRQEDEALPVDAQVIGFPPLTQLPRASGLFGTYDRLEDNVFPYGPATPNRRGVGAELDVKAGKEGAFRLPASAYKVEEKSGNLVLDALNTFFVSVDAAPGDPEIVRDFLYVNVGPSVNLGPLAGLSRDLELGFNFRSERTESRIGVLKSKSILGSLRVEAADWLEMEPFGKVENAEGTETGMGGTTEARYSYRFDNQDLAAYSVFETEKESILLGGALTFRVTGNSKLYLDWLQVKTTDPKRFSGETVRRSARAVYEIHF